VGSFTTSRFEVEFPYLNDGTPALVCYWGRWADARGGTGPFSKTCVARVEGGAFALPEPVYVGGHRPQLGGASVSRKIEPRAFPMLEAAVAGAQHELLCESVQVRVTRPEPRLLNAA